jgi:hypothetical protein
METIEAELVSTGEKYFIKINAEPEILIPISEDNANTVKSAFSALIRRLKSGLFKVVLKEAEKDLFYHVATEYLGQLNGELAEVYEEMEQFGFIDVLDGRKSGDIIPI